MQGPFGYKEDQLAREKKQITRNICSWCHGGMFLFFFIFVSRLLNSQTKLSLAIDFNLHGICLIEICLVGGRNAIDFVGEHTLTIIWSV